MSKSRAYAIFDYEDRIIHHTLRPTAQICWEDFERFKHCDKWLLQRDEKEYGYKCKRVYIEHE